MIKETLLIIQERLEHPFTMEMEQCLNSWVLNHYRQHYTYDLFREIFATIPQARAH